MGKQDIKKEYIQNAGGCFVTKSVMEGKTKIRWVSRGEPQFPEDSGWSIIGDKDTQEYIDDSKNVMICNFNSVIDLDPIMSYIYNMPAGTELELVYDKSDVYFLNSKTGEIIRERVKSQMQLIFEKNLEFLRSRKVDVETVNSIFNSKKEVRTFKLGNVEFPTGKIIVADPLCYLQSPQNISILEKQIPKGKYDVTLAIIDSKIVGRRIAGARLKVSNNHAVSYELAKDLCLDENGKITKKYGFSGFGVETGTGCFCDIYAARKYWDFLARWYKKNPGKNLYNDYFEKFFVDSYKHNPDYQREGGDFIIWKNPIDDSQIAIFSSGLGDGFYCPFLGIDVDGEITEIVTIFVNPELF